MNAASNVVFMIQCSKCGQGNADRTQYCRFCGNRLNSHANEPWQAPPEDHGYAPPRPYAWKTDEYQTQADRRVHSPINNQPFVQGQPLTYQGGAHYAMSGYRCPNCGTSVMPIIERRISTAGWITFALLLVFTFIFFWIGLLIRENVTVCPICRVTLK